MALRKYVSNPKEGGEEAGKRTEPFRWMIDGFSTIANRGADMYYSRSFTACGFNWKLQLASVLEEDGEKYVGIYLLNDDADSKISKIKAIYKLFIYDQLHAEHIQKEGENYFHSKSHGFCCKVASNKFNCSKSGLLVNDRCVFGAQVLEAFACQSDEKGIHESLSLNKDLTPRIYTWVIKDVSKSKDKLISGTFAAGGYSWRIWLYPNLATYKDCLGVFLMMDNAASLSSKTSVYVDFSLCLLDLHNANHRKLTVKYLFSSKSATVGFPKFLSWKEVQDPSRGFLLNDTCIVEASVVVLGVDTIH
ncbi:probable inactive serine/threonine-protein kinase fnkC [Zingiber officinale]|uniref:MATH domain-containing protein n=1 Tax=Zingiber officinale TaxID=94328 RepID=A0A8J5G763_ZINOF|nr:probable inactive serine/threonine-protein kinase fnkC [Zingiber officinale]KAG6497623.1 hypothetical protein ZIOFF_045527 [Zingiber officinale]